jgi:hypothetical protein
MTSIASISWTMESLKGFWCGSGKKVGADGDVRVVIDKSVDIDIDMLAAEVAVETAAEDLLRTMVECTTEDVAAEV